MPRYTFTLKNGESGVDDENGISLPNREVAYCYACDVVHELMQHREVRTRHWQLDVHEDGGKVFEIPFASLDPTLDHLSQKQRILIEQGAQQIRSAQETLHAASLTRQETRSLLAWSRGAPYLVASGGRKIIRD